MVRLWRSIWDQRRPPAIASSERRYRRSWLTFGSETNACIALTLDKRTIPQFQKNGLNAESRKLLILCRGRPGRPATFQYSCAIFGIITVDYPPAEAVAGKFSEGC